MGRGLALTSSQKIAKCKKDIYLYVVGQMALHDITQRDLAEYIGITQPTISYHMKRKEVTLEMFLGIVRLVNPENTELERLFK